MTNSIGIGFLGGGMIAQIAHIPFFVADPRCRVVAISEDRPSLLDHLGKLAPDARIVPSYRDLLGDPEVEAVVVSAPRAATGVLTLAALEAGKHVLAEKPMAFTVEQAAALVDAARERDRVYAVGFMKRCDPGVVAAKALVDDVLRTGRMGRLRAARVFDHSRSYAAAVPPHARPSESRVERYDSWPTAPSWLPERLREMYGWFMNAASHDVNLMRHLLGSEFEVLSAHAPNADVVLASLKGPDDSAVSFEASRVAAGVWLEGIEIYFETGHISLSIPSPMATDRVSVVTVDDPSQGLVGATLETGRGWSFAAQATAFVDSVTGLRAPPTSGEDGLADIELIEAIWKKVAEAP